MRIRHAVGCCLVVLLSFSNLSAAAGSDLADAAMRGDTKSVRTLLQQKSADINARQSDGSTALHWVVRSDDLELVDMLIRAGADVKAANRLGATPMLLASDGGSAPMIEKLLKAGVDPNAPLTPGGDTALMMAARTGKADVIKALLDNGAKVDLKETWGGTTALMWAVSEGHLDAARMLLDRGADVNARSKYVPPFTSRGFDGATPAERKPGSPPEQHAGGEMTPLMFAARQGDLESTRMLLQAGADVNATAADGKNVLGIAAFNSNYDLGVFLIERGADVNHADAWGFTPLFWAVDRRNMETAASLPWMQTGDGYALIEKLLAAGANPNALINNIPESRTRTGTSRVVFSTALMRAAFSADLKVVRLLLTYGADPFVVSRDYESTLAAAAGTGFIPGFSYGRPAAERLEVVRLLVDLGVDVNEADDYGITPLMVAANLGQVGLIQYLVDAGADLGAYDWGKKNNVSFNASVEPLMPIDYAIGVGTFRPNGAVVANDEATQLMERMMKERGIAHTTSECTLRGFTCSSVDVEPKTASPAQVEAMRKFQTGSKVEGVTGGLGLKNDIDKDKDGGKK